ncbi:MAG: histidine kinase [Prevotella sp.]|nr:histidine kinase [Prevotella sp.]
MTRRFWMKQSRQENIIYLAVWGLLFAAPILSLYMRTLSDTHAVFDWTEVFIVWRKLVLYLLLFLVHNFFLAPLLVHGHKRVAYFSIVATLLVGFTVYQCNSRPEILPKGPRPPMERAGHRQDADANHFPPKPPFDEPPRAFDGEHRPPKGFVPLADNPPPIVGERDILAVIVLFLMFGANLGIKGFFRSREDRKRLAALEKQNLEQQLEYLRYQINPHFFMNTLNNIHALVDIDPEKAKDTILELSKMMRFLLYEGNKQGVPLSRELDFIRHYVTLMQLRYTDKVRISMDLPQEVPDRQLPPLILITFIENAFKHGISYQHESFIEAKVAVEGETLRFSCRNSKAEKPNEEKGGVGLNNVRRRLNLIYDKKYSLNIKNEPEIYTVELNIPLL